MPFGFCSVGTVNFATLCDCYNLHFSPNECTVKQMLIFLHYFLVYLCHHFERMQLLLILGGLFMSGHFSQTVAALGSMHLSPTLIILAKATLAFPFCFHFVNGIRHLVSVIFLNASNLLSYGIIK